MEFIETLMLLGGQLVGIAVTTEAVVETLLKRLFPTNPTPEQDQLMALAVAIAIAVGTFVWLIPPFASVAANLTAGIIGGAIASRGSNFVHDFLNILEGYASVMKLKGSVANEYKD